MSSHLDDDSANRRRDHDVHGEGPEKSHPDIPSVSNRQLDMQGSLVDGGSRRSRSRSGSRIESGRLQSSHEYTSKDRPKSATATRKSRFLQRWSDDERVARALTYEAECNRGAEKEALPYIYQQAEFIRICGDIIRKFDGEHALCKFLSLLDEGSAIDLNSYLDAQMRKKFRHLGKALYLSRTDSYLRKPDECNISLLEAFHEKRPYILQKVEAKGPYVRPTQYDQRAEEPTGDHSATTMGTISAPDTAEMLSLREMHEQGFFVDYDNVKKFMDKHAIHDVWGKTPQEQLKLMRAKDLPKDGECEEASEPWKVFDREKEIVSATKIDKVSYDRLLQSNKDFRDSFTEGKYHSSFI